MTTSWTGPPETETWWVCCNEDCKRENNPATSDEKCVDCGHAKCDNCGSVQHEIPPVSGHFHHQARYTDLRYRAHNVHFNNETPEGGHHGGIFFCGSYTDTEPQDTHPGPTAGWWQCCQCGREVNPALCGDDCPDCGHIRDDYCYNL